MYIVSVIPIVSGISKDTLTYSSEKSLALGSVISCPFRNKSIDCIVIEQRTLREAKTELRSARFTVKKIADTTLPRNLISKHYIQTLITTSHYYGISYSECFNLLVPKTLVHANFSFLPFSKSSQLTTLEYKEIPKADTANFYQSELLGGIAVIVAPTKERVIALQKKLQGSIALHSGVAASRQTKILSSISESNSGMYICTPQFISFFHQATVVYIDSFYSSNYTTLVAPFINTLQVIQDYSCKIAERVIAIDSLVYEVDSEKTALSFKTIDMTDSKNGTKYIWQSPYLEKLLKHNQGQGKNTLLYVHRKGLSAYLSCEDCKTAVECVCGTPFSLFIQEDGSRRLSCSMCKKVVQLDAQKSISCGMCGSWKLKGYGITSEMIGRDVADLGYSTFVIDSEHTKTPLKIRNVYSEFSSTKGGVLIATEQCLDYLEDIIDSICIVSIDSMLLLPEYTTDAAVLQKVATLASYSKSQLHIQTRLPKHPILQINDSENLNGWKKEYLSDLASFLLPPYGVSIKIVKKGFFTTDEVKIVDAALLGQSASYRNFRSNSYMTARVSKEFWNNSELWISYKISLLRSTCDVFIE